MIVSVEEAREILGKEAEKMTDAQIIELVQNLDAIAVAALRDVMAKRKEDAMDLANLIYDIHRDKKHTNNK